MSRSRKILTTAGILVLGVCAAMPFYRADDKEFAALDSPIDDMVPWRSGADMPLQVVTGESQTAPPLTTSQREHNDKVPVSVGRSNRKKTSEVSEDFESLRRKTLNSRVTDVVRIESKEHVADVPAQTSSPEPEPEKPTPKLEQVNPKHPQGLGLEQGTDEAAQEKIPDPKTVPSIQCHDERQPKPKQIKHVIVDGDTLPDLAERYLGSRSLHLEIFKANPNLPTPSALPIGMEIVIPQVGMTNTTNEAADERILKDTTLFRTGPSTDSRPLSPPP